MNGVHGYKLFAIGLADVHCVDIAVFVRVAYHALFSAVRIVEFCYFFVYHVILYENAECVMRNSELN